MTHIDITLIFGEKKMDMRIPIRIEVSHLIRELDKIFNYDKPRVKSQLRVLNKGFVLDEGDLLVDYPIATGDIIVVEEIDSD